MIDTITVAKMLEQDGINSEQAEAIAKAIGPKEDRLATKEDIARLREAIIKLEKSNKEAMARLEKSIAKLENSVARLEKSNKENITRLENRLDKRMDAQRTLLFCLVGGLGLLITVYEFIG